MARDLDDLPVYDPVLKPGTNYLSGVWSDMLASLIESLQEYLSQLGIFIPKVTTAQRDAIQSPVAGQMIYNTTLNSAQYFKNGVWTSF